MRLEYGIVDWGQFELEPNRPPSTGLSDAHQVPDWPCSMPAWLQLWWRGQTFYSTWPIIGLFDLFGLFDGTIYIVLYALFYAFWIIVCPDIFIF